MTTRQQQDARHREAVRTYYETGNESLLGPVLAELRPRLVDFLKGRGLRDPQRVEDFVQDALATTLTSLRAHKFTFAGSVASWAMTICMFSFTTSYKRKTDWITQPG
jgi:DNA-directed RNA polymerase specialized sigma24 family protein